MNESEIVMSDAEALEWLERMVVAERRAASVAAVRNTPSMTESMRRSEPRRLLKRAAALERGVIALSALMSIDGGKRGIA